VHCAITDTIVSAIEAGAKEYRMPWHQGITRPVNAATGKAYHGVNVLALWAAGKGRGFQSGYWATYRQWASLQAQVRKGERGSIVVFYKSVDIDTDDKETATEAPPAPRTKLVARASWVFNADQVDGWTAPQAQQQSQVQIRANAEAFIEASRAAIRHGGNMAYYAPTGDYIAVPHPAQFFATKTSTATEAYYAVVLHELTHWSGAAHRLARNLSVRFGDHAYAMEELVAEFGAAFLCADLHIANEPRADHAAYVSSWLHVLNEDRTALFTAASKASVAATFLSDLAHASRRDVAT
jgi:antirestriction protein ArdC